jgi:hypothetical protein
MQIKHLAGNVRIVTALTRRQALSGGTVEFWTHANRGFPRD